MCEWRYTHSRECGFISENLKVQLTHKREIDEEHGCFVLWTTRFRFWTCGLWDLEKEKLRGNIITLYAK